MFIKRDLKMDVMQDVNKNLLPILKPRDRVFEVYEYVPPEKLIGPTVDLRKIVGWKVVRNSYLDRFLGMVIAVVAYLTMSLITKLGVSFFAPQFTLSQAAFLTACAVIVYSLFSDPMEKYLN